ncbi:hypothetical protein AB0B79_41255, partial [Streptomyces sp. NPDC039022]|uniref:hypothetical protein n=1 Tax=Streptomyces sp. NPDC039022 TaxID=3157091 RepID=UPI0033F5F3C4
SPSYGGRRCPRDGTGHLQRPAPRRHLAALALAALWWRIGRRSYLQRRASTSTSQTHAEEDGEFKGIV